VCLRRFIIIITMADRVLYEVVSTFGKGIWAAAEPVIDRVFPVSETARRRISGEVRNLIGDKDGNKKTVKITYPKVKPLIDPYLTPKQRKRTIKIKKPKVVKRKYRKRAKAIPKRPLIYQDRVINYNPKWNVKRYLRRFPNSKSFYAVR